VIHRTTLCIAILVLVACGGPGTPYPESLTQTEGNLTAVLEVSPYPPVPMQDATLALSLQADGKPVSGATTTLNITMLDCTMAPDNPAATEEEVGIYRARTIFTMSGAYRIKATVAVEGESHVFIFYLATI
jgi:hypothetical protein